MYSSVMNAVIKLLLSQGNKINCFNGGGGGGGRGGGEDSLKKQLQMCWHRYQVFQGSIFAWESGSRFFGDFLN